MVLVRYRNPNFIRETEAQKRKGIVASKTAKNPISFPDLPLYHLRRDRCPPAGVHVYGEQQPYNPLILHQG